MINPIGFLIFVLVWILAGGATLATVLSFAGSWWWIAGMMEHFRVQYCLIFIAALTINFAFWKYWQINGWGKLLGLGLDFDVNAALTSNVKLFSNINWSFLWLMCLVVNLTFIAPLFFGANQNLSDRGKDVTQSSPQSSQPLTVLHVTLDHDNPDISRAIAYIQRQTPDIVSLLEVTPQSLPQFQSALPSYQLVIAEPRTNSHGSAWLVSKQPSNSIEIEDKALIHLPSYSDRPLLQLTIRYSDQTIDLLCFHVIRPRNSNTVAFQKIEFNALAQWSQALLQKGHSVIAIGDFNSTPWYGAFRQLLTTSGLVNSLRGFGLQTTWHAALPPLLRIPIDHCLYSPLLVATQRIIGPNIGSDHLPLLVAFRVTH